MIKGVYCMNQEKIGKFIAELRKEKGITQEQIKKLKLNLYYLE